MAKAISDDLRVRILEAHARGEGSCRVLAERFGVSWEYVRKIRQQERKSGQRERVPQARRGLPSPVTEPVQQRMLALVEAQKDLTIAELRDRLGAATGVRMGWTSVQRWTKRLGLRLKKSRSTPLNATPKPTGSGARSFTKRS